MNNRTRIQNIETLANAIAWRSDAATSDQMAFDLVVDEDELKTAERLLQELHDRLEAEVHRVATGGCTDPGGHDWDKSAGEADEARISRDWANDRITCLHCGADGDS